MKTTTEDKMLNELFAVPKGVELATEFSGGLKVYTSDVLKKKYILSISKTNSTKSLSSTIYSLVNSGLIVPCFLTKGLISYVLYKMLAPVSTKNILGFYLPSEKKIYLFIDNNVNAFGFASNDSLASLTIHECIHMLSDKNPKVFYSIFKTELIEYYNSLFTEIFKLDGKQGKIIEEIVDYIYKLENKLSRNNSALINYHKILEKLKKNSQLDEKTFNNTLRNLIVIIKVFWKDPDAFFSLQRKFRHILGPLYNSYNRVFKIRIKGTAIQEFFTLSEVISMSSEHKTKITNKIYSALKKLK